MEVAALESQTVEPAGNDDDGFTTNAIAAEVAEAVRNAAQPLDPMQRAIEGFRLAAGPPAARGLRAQTIADAAANARKILERTDLPPGQGATIKNSVVRLGNAIIDDKLAPQINSRFREDLYKLASEPVGSDNYKAAAGQLTAAARVLDQVELAPGTKLQYDPKAGAPTDPKTGFPKLDVDQLDADLHYKTN
ncbi:MAG TPA: hypothetical protein VGM15_04740, partial [Burkholderiaceae bacterium]